MEERPLDLKLWRRTWEGHRDTGTLLAATASFHSEDFGGAGGNRTEGGVDYT
jgi:hypothetical protein